MAKISMAKKKRAAIYARVSTDGQTTDNDALGLETPTMLDTVLINPALTIGPASSLL